MTLEKLRFSPRPDLKVDVNAHFVLSTALNEHDIDSLLAQFKELLLKEKKSLHIRKNAGELIRTSYTQNEVEALKPLELLEIFSHLGRQSPHKGLLSKNPGENPSRPLYSYRYGWKQSSSPLELYWQEGWIGLSKTPPPALAEEALSNAQAIELIYHNTPLGAGKSLADFYRLLARTWEEITY